MIEKREVNKMNKEEVKIIFNVVDARVHFDIQTICNEAELVWLIERLDYCYKFLRTLRGGENE